jgi:hypothetical protein
LSLFPQPKKQKKEYLQRLCGNGILAESIMIAGKPAHYFLSYDRKYKIYISTFGLPTQPVPFNGYKRWHSLA